MKNYNRWNNIIGWLACIVASAVYILTAERTTSWWDCGEYISTAFKLQVGHPPGAPTFQWLGNLFSLLAGGDIMKVGFMINVMSALFSGFTILFLFWSITIFAKKLVLINDHDKNRDLSLGEAIMVFGAGIVGAMAYTFTDSFWFSAVEGEVYAMSSFFTAITFWAILKWEAVADQAHNLRWLIFISFLIGLAIGVHLLNLLVIPAVVFVIYYRKFKPTRKGFWYSLGISAVLLGLILWVIIPYIVNLAGKFDFFFVNSFGLPFNSGTYIYFALLIGAIVWGILYAIKKNKVVLHTALLCLVFLLIGYSTFFIIVIRSNAGVPINENEPKNAYSLLDYLNREQYGSRPLFYGQYFNAPRIGTKVNYERYMRNDSTGRYVSAGQSLDYEYDPAYCGLFPRMHSSDDGRGHVTYYKIWSGTPGNRKPTFSENIRFLVRYQLGWQYMRYFMWNFVGRQNNTPGLGFDQGGSRDVLHGNWISGINAIDEARLGPQKNLPDFQKNNQARNRYYFLPLILGLVGLIYQYRKDKRNTFVVFLLFFMTGIAIVLYLNQPSTEPRERDYSVVGSFYAFSIWIGLGVMAIAQLIRKYLKAPLTVAAASATVLSFVAVPALLCSENWDDHDRSRKTTARDFARNTLESCEPNAILFTNGDNDTFPVWFCQEVENVRTDIRVINSALANSYWHIQPLFRKIYDSDPLPFTLRHDQYGQSVNDQIFVTDRGVGRQELSSLLRFVASDNRQTKVQTQSGLWMGYFPTKSYRLSINKQQLLDEGIITPEQVPFTVDHMDFDINSEGLGRADLAILDIVASNQWRRPIYVASPYAQRNILPITEFAQMEGNVHRFVPYHNPNKEFTASRENGIATDKTYDLFVNKFTWGNLQDPKALVDYDSYSAAIGARQSYAFLAQALIGEGKNDSAVRVLDKCFEFFPHEKVPLDRVCVYHVQAYFMAGAFDKGLALANQITDVFERSLLYFESFPAKPAYSRLISNEVQDCMSVFYSLRNQFLNNYPEQTKELFARLDGILEHRIPKQ